MSIFIKALIALLLLLTSTGIFASVSQSTFDALSRAQVLIEQEQYDQARSVLEIRGRLTSTEQGWLYYLTAISYLHQERFDSALKLLKLAESSQGLDDSTEIQIQQQIAQVALQQEDYQTARDYYHLVLQNNPQQIKFWRGLSFAEYQLKNLVPAHDAINQAIQLSSVASEDDYELRLGIENQAQMYPEMIRTLQTMQDLFDPKGERLRLLAHLQLQQKNSRAALATLKIAQAKGLLEPAELQLMAQLYYNEGAYQRSAEVIQGGLELGGLKPSVEIEQQLLQSYLAARDWRAARDLLLQLPDSTLRRQQLLAVQKQMEDWTGIIEQLQPALPHDANGWFELGYAHWRLGDSKQAQHAWQQSIALEPEHMAGSWLKLNLRLFE